MLFMSLIRKPGPTAHSFAVLFISWAPLFSSPIRRERVVVITSDNLSRPRPAMPTAHCGAARLQHPFQSERLRRLSLSLHLSLAGRGCRGWPHLFFNARSLASPLPPSFGISTSQEFHLASRSGEYLPRTARSRHRAR